jgi:hypothetical protein
MRVERWFMRIAVTASGTRDEAVGSRIFTVNCPVPVIAPNTFKG